MSGELNTPATLLTGQRNRCVPWMRFWVGLTAGLDALELRKIETQFPELGPQLKTVKGTEGG